MLIQGDLHHLRCSIVDKLGALVVGGKLQQLLAQVVAERI